IDTAIGDGTLQRAMQHGMTFSSEEHSFSGLMNGSEESQSKIINALNQVKNAKDNLFEKPTFGRFIPSQKINLYKDLEQQYIKKGLDPNQAAYSAAHDTNTIFGGINVKELGRDPNVQSILQTAFFAPDFAESNIRLAGSAVKALMNPKNPTGAPYRNALTNLVGLYVTGNLLNKEMTGHYMTENDPRHSFDIDTGAKNPDGSEIYYRMFGSAADVPKFLGEIAFSVAHNRADAIPTIVKNHLSPEAGLLVDSVENENYAHKPIVGPDKYGRPQSLSQQGLNIANELADKTAPYSTESLEGLIQGKLNPFGAISQSIGLPITNAHLPSAGPRMRLRP